jgi:glycosyltransferase involved in cell wall biosynthesis
MRILLATEEITRRPSEGLLVFVMHLARFLGGIGELTLLYAAGEPESELRALRLLSHKTMITKGLLQLSRRESFDIAVYVPSSSLTAYGLLRGILLRSLFKTSTIMIALQLRKVGALHAIVARGRTPELILSPVEELRRNMEQLGVRTGFIIPGFDEGLFKPIRSELKAALRRKYGLPENEYIVLHVGHIRESRNMQVFLKHREWGRDIVPVVKGGEVDPAWLHRLQMAGVIVIDEYIEQMHELYQAADCYLFPVSSPTGALEFPLSVIEAAACDLPVITTRFGALPSVIREAEDFRYIRSMSEIPERIRAVRSSTPQTSARVVDLSWSMVFSKYLEPHIRRLTRKHGKEDVR